MAAGGHVIVGHLQQQRHLQRAAELLPQGYRQLATLIGEHHRQHRFQAGARGRQQGLGFR